MKIPKKTIGIMIITLCIIFSNTACSSFDASAYTQAVLDVNFKNESVQYIKMTSESQDAANTIFLDNVDGIFSSFLSGIVVSNDVTKQGKQVFADLLQATKYTVGKSKKTEEGYVVEVKFCQMKIFQSAISEYSIQIDEYTKQLKKDADEGADIPDNQEINNYVTTLLLDILQDKLDHGITYENEKTLTIHIEKDNDNMYVMNQNDYKQMISYAMDIEDLKKLEAIED